MAGGIDWFRWHHGSVTDPKFQLVARKAGVGLPDVIAVWAFVLEKASASEERGSFGDLDHEAIDCLFGMDDGKTLAILEQMEVRGLVADGCICAWDKRQPKREREDDTAAERKRRQRERDANQSHDTPSSADQSHVTPCHTTSHQKTPRGEERREEEITPSLRSVVSAKPRPTKKCPDSFVVTDDLKAWAEEECPGVDLVKQTATFRDYTFKTARSDWPSTWRNWMRKACEFSQPARANPQARPPTAAQMAMAQACPSLVAPHLQQYAPQQPAYAEVINADARLLD